MNRVIFLDSEPVGLAADPRPRPRAVECRRWLERRRESNDSVTVPEIVDYEVRRELLRLERWDSLHYLDQLLEANDYLPINTAAMRVAASLWGAARRQGRPTAGSNALDGDVILSAQALFFGAENFVVATGNVKHLSRFVPAMYWADIT